MGCTTSTEQKIPANFRPKDPTGNYPVYGSRSLMNKKAYGTSEFPVQKNLRWKCDSKTADRIANHNRHGAEPSGYFLTRYSFLAAIRKAKRQGTTITFYDCNSGKPLFEAPKNRSWDDFLEESKTHGWPSFRDAEVCWQNVRCLVGGETVSLTGTHLGHNLPKNGNRYCINLVCIAGSPTDDDEIAMHPKSANEGPASNETEV